MRRTKLGIIVCLAISLFVLLTVPSLTSFTIKSAHAMGWTEPPPGPGPGGGDGGDGGHHHHSHSPEPATWLLIGAGAAGLGLFRKKLKK
jgi:hypothetical protein